MPKASISFSRRVGPSPRALVRELITAIQAKLIITLRKYQEMKAVLDADHLHGPRPRRHAFDKHTANQIVRLIGIHLEAQILTHTRVASISANHKPRPEFEFRAVVDAADEGTQSRRYRYVTGAAEQRGACRRRQLREDIAGRRVAEAEPAKSFWCIFVRSSARASASAGAKFSS